VLRGNGTFWISAFLSIAISLISVTMLSAVSSSSSNAFAFHSAPGSYVINIVPGAAEKAALVHYYPPLISVPANTLVTWFNADPGQLHTATSGQPNSTDAGRIFNSGHVPFQYFYSYKFDAPGNYTYFCELHPQEFGVIAVNGQLMKKNNFEFSSGTGAFSWNLTETNRNLMRFEPFTTSLAGTDSATYRVIISDSNNNTAFSETLTSGNNLNLEVVATGGNRSLYGPDSGPLGTQVIVNGAFHVEGEVRPGDYTIRVELTSINGRQIDPLADEFDMRVTA
jgi:plastocyanin